MNPASDLLPRGKHDIERATALAALGYPSVEPVLAKMLEWTQDPNWPVARVLSPFLATIGEPLAPYIRTVFASDDDIWKSSVLATVISKSPMLAQALQSDLMRFAQNPTVGERAEGVDVQSKELLRGA